MPRPGVVSQRRRVARNYNVHVLTLAQVTPHLRVDGSWPGPITLSSGWLRARARPWNETVTDPMIRLDRGGAEFLAAVTEALGDLVGGAVYSPALYGGSTRVWRRSGYRDFATLSIMERALNGGRARRAIEEAQIEDEPDWTEVVELDRQAFEGFWGMSALALQEAYETNRSTALIVSRNEGRLAGYAIVGSQWGTVYLHRIAVRPEESGRGLGAALLTASIDWGKGTGSRSLILNVRPDNDRAIRLYERLGFANTGTALQVLRHDRG